MPSSTRAGLSPVMVGRAHELDRLRHLAAAGDGLRVVLLAGEAGVGKSRLVQELVASLPPRRRALVGRADESGAGHPYQLLLDAVAGDVRGWDRVPADLEPWSDPIGALLGPVAPRLTGAVRGYGPDELLGGAGELVRQLVGGDGAVVVFEDLHWADPDSLNLFRGLAAASDIDALLIGTFRPEGLDRPHVRELLAAVERLSQVEHIVLRRLDVDEVGSLVGAIRHTEVGYRVAADLHQRTAGNPFFLEQLLEAAGDTPVVSLVDQALPVSVTEAVLGRVESLDPDCRRVTEAAAVLGPRVDFDVLVEATGLDEDRLMSALRTAVAGGLLVEEETDLFSFRHALTREAVASRLLGRERRRLHEKALDMLRRAGSKDWATIAHHAAGAGRTGEMVEAARLGAAHHLRMGATYQALRLADAALAEEDDDVDLLETAARASWAVGLSRSALDRAEQWRRRSELEGDLESMSRSLRLIARLRWETGDRDGHAEAVAAAADLAEKLPIGPERGWVANLVCESAMLRGDHAAAVAVADEALTVAGEPPPPDLQAAVLVNKGSALIATVEGAEEGEALLLRAIDAAEQVQDWLSALRAVNNLSHSVLPLWEPERSWELIDRMGALIARSGRQDWTSSWHGLRAVWHAHVVGDLAAARAEAAVGGLGWARSWWGRAVDAELALEAGVDQDLPGLEGGGEAVTAATLRVRAAARTRDVDAIAAAVAELVVAMGEVAASARAHDSDAWHHALTTALQAGLPPATLDRLTAGLNPLPGPDGRRGDPFWPEHLMGARAEAEGDLATAVDHYRAATGAPEWRRSPPAAADAHLGAARSCIGLGRRDEATNHLREAGFLLARWDGWRRRDMEALAARLRLAPRGTTEELTTREEQVAELVAEGLSNGEIGARLYISTKTASVHVSNILRKLGVDSRAAIAAWAARRSAAAGGPVGD